MRERQHLAMAGSRHHHSPRNATAHRAARANSHDHFGAQTQRLRSGYVDWRCYDGGPWSRSSLSSLKADAVLLMWCGSIGFSVQQCPLIIGFFVPFCRRKLSPIFSRRGSASDWEEDVSRNFRGWWVLPPEVAFAYYLEYF